MKVKVTLKKSLIGATPNQKATAASLGLRKIGDVAVLPDNPSVRGMIFKVKHLVEVEEN